MGAEPWTIYTRYNPDIHKAMEDAQAEVFATGAYRNSTQLPDSIEDARELDPESGTASILDMYEAAEKPRLQRHGDDGEMNLDTLMETMGRMFPMYADDLTTLYGTTQPTRKMVDANRDYFDWLERGVGLYIVVYENGKPSEILFAGYSVD